MDMMGVVAEELICRIDCQGLGGGGFAGLCHAEGVEIFYPFRWAVSVVLSVPGSSRHGVSFVRLAVWVQQRSPWSVFAGCGLLVWRIPVGVVVLCGGNIAAVGWFSMV